MANLGIGLGAFLNGINQGTQAYESIESARDRKRLRDIAKDGTAQAQANRAADVEKAVTVGSADQNGMTVPTYTVGNKSYANQDEAMKAADKDVGTFMDYYSKTVLPQYQQHWMETGQVDKAQAMDRWMESEDVKKGTKAWAGAVRAFQMGDSAGFKENLMKAYNQNGYFDDGMEATKIEDINNDKGQLLGYAITFKGPDGKETTQSYDGDDVAKLGLQALAPDKVLEYGFDQLKQRNALQAALAKEQRGLSSDMLKIDANNQARVGQLAYASQLRRQENAEKVTAQGAGKKVAEANAIATALSANGMPQEMVRALYPQLLGVERASKSSRDRLDGYIDTMAKADMDFAQLPVSEQVARAQKLMEEIDGAARAQTPAAQAPAQRAANPVQSGRGVPVFDTRTNQITYQ